MVESESESSMSSMDEIGSESSIDEMERELLIEKEPRTLNSDQLQFAREAALHVMKTRSAEEAMRSFTQGLHPVESGAMNNRGALMDSGEEWVDELQFPLMDLEEEWIDEPRIAGPREIVTAPF